MLSVAPLMMFCFNGSLEVWRGPFVSQPACGDAWQSGCRWSWKGILLCWFEHFGVILSTEVTWSDMKRLNEHCKIYHVECRWHNRAKHRFSLAWCSLRLRSAQVWQAPVSVSFPDSQRLGLDGWCVGASTCLSPRQFLRQSRILPQPSIASLELGEFRLSDVL